jgi:DNA-binding transcriptional regulator YhcF (GntR family)
MTGGYVDPQSDLVKAVLIEKVTRLTTDAVEQLVDEADRRGLPRAEALSICKATIAELEERNEPDHVYQRMCEAVDVEIERRS